MKNQKMGSKGMSLPIETVIILVLAAIVLAALLAFFLGVFNPGNQRVKTLGDLQSACFRYVSLDPDCDPAAANLETSEVYTAISTIAGTDDGKNFGCTSGGSKASIVASCCRVYCPSESAE